MNTKLEKLIDWFEKHPFGALVVFSTTISYLSLVVGIFMYTKILFACFVFGLLTIAYTWALFAIKCVVENKMK